MSKKKLNDTKQTITDQSTSLTRTRNNGFRVKCINQRSRKVLIKLSNELKKANADYVEKINMYIKGQPTNIKPHVTLEPLDVHPNHILLRRPDMTLDPLNKSFHKKQFSHRNNLHMSQVGSNTLSTPVLTQFR